MLAAPDTRMRARTVTPLLGDPVPGGYRAGCHSFPGEPAPTGVPGLAVAAAGAAVAGATASAEAGLMGWSKLVGA
jgi:hypothetical protein